MRTFCRYLWKEWRDQRTIVLGFALILPALLLLVRWLVPGRDIVGDALFPWVVAAGSGSIALLSVGSDLIPGEERRGTIAFLRRMPDGLLPPFLAKVVLFVAAVAGFCAYGWLLATWIGRVDGAQDHRWTKWIPWLLALLPWVLAVSCWLPRGSLALPGTALFLAVLAAPLAWIGWHSRYLPSWLLVPGNLALVSAPLALLVAALSFARFRRFGRGPLAAAWRGALLTLLAAVPLYADVGLRVHRWQTLDVEAGTLRLSPIAYVGPGGRLAFLNASNLVDGGYNPTHAIVVDLETGAYREGAALYDDFVPHWWIEPVFGWAPITTPVDLVPLNEVFTQRRGDLWLRWLDGRTGETVDSGWRSMLSAGLREQVDAARRASTTVRLPDGRRAWFAFGKVRWTTRDGEVREADPGFAVQRAEPCGAGYRLKGEKLSARFDLREERFLDEGERDPLPVDLPDGRFLRLEEGRLFAVDPRTGEREQLPGTFRTLAPAGYTPGDVAIRLVDGERFATYREGVWRRTAALPKGSMSPRLLAALDEDTLLVLTDRAVYRLRFGSEERERLFPR